MDGDTGTTSTDPAIVQAGTAGQSSQAAEKPVIIGAADRPIEPGGPGIGAARLAHEETGFASRPLTAGAETALTLRPLSDTERAELAQLRKQPDEREELEMLRRVRGVVVDAADVQGRRLARAATTIKRDGVTYGPGGEREWVPVDFAAYTELVSIGAITDTRWDLLEPVE